MPRRPELVYRARELYARGLSRAQIARFLGVSPRTISRWRRFDEQEDRDWDRARTQLHRLQPSRVLRALERQFGELVLERVPQGENAQEARRDKQKRLLEMARVIQAYRKSAGELTMQVRALEAFAIYCSENLSREALSAVQEALEGFISQLKEENR